MSEQFDWLWKRLTENRRDAIWGVILVALCFWFTASVETIMGTAVLTNIPAWAIIPVITIVMIGFLVSIFGVIAALACVAVALGKKEE